MAKLKSVLTLKDVAAQMQHIMNNMQQELADIRGKISALEDERKTISHYSLNRSDLLTASLVNIDNLHNELVNKMKERIMITADRTHRKADYGGTTVSFLEDVMKGNSSEIMFSRLTGFDYSKTHETLFLYSHEEVKRAFTSAFESISDADWPECSSVSGTDSLVRLAEIDDELTVLHRREGELITAANLEGVDIGQAFQPADSCIIL